MTFDEFCKEFKVKEAEAHELVDFLASCRMKQTLRLHSRVLPDKSASEIIEEWRQS